MRVLYGLEKSFLTSTVLRCCAVRIFHFGEKTSFAILMLILVSLRLHYSWLVMQLSGAWRSWGRRSMTLQNMGAPKLSWLTVLNAEYLFREQKSLSSF